MKKARGYSLWLTPSGTEYEKLSTVIGKLSKTHKTPFFEPHVTLLGGLEKKEDVIIARTKKLAEVLGPFTITLVRLEQRDTYFQCLFYRVEETTNVLNAHTRACDVFRISEGMKYMPHLSVMYGDISQKTKEQIISGSNAVKNMRFSVQHIDLFSTDGEVEKWYKVQRFHL